MHQSRKRTPGFGHPYGGPGPVPRLLTHLHAAELGVRQERRRLRRPSEPQPAIFRRPCEDYGKALTLLQTLHAPVLQRRGGPELLAPPTRGLFQLALIPQPRKDYGDAY